MNKTKKFFLLCFVAGVTFIYLSIFVDNILFQFFVWADINHEYAWQVLKITQILTVPLSTTILILSFLCKILKVDLTTDLTKKKRDSFLLFFRINGYVMIVLYFLSGIHYRYVGQIGDEFNLTRAHGFLNLVNFLFVVLAVKAIGFSEINN